MAEFYVYGIAYDKDCDRGPWKWHVNDPFDSTEEALQCVKKNKEKLNLICSWISIAQGETLSIIFHETYVNILGYPANSLDISIPLKGDKK